MQLFVYLVVAVGLTTGQTVLEVARAGGANNFVDLIESNGLDGKFSGDGPFTLFAPLDAFWSSPPEYVIDDMVNLLNYHALPSILMQSDMSDNLLVVSEQGADFRINFYTASDSSEIISGAGSDIMMFDQPASNGVVHFVRIFIESYPTGSIMDFIDGNPSYSIYADAVRAAGLDGDLSDPDNMWTVLITENVGMAGNPNPGTDELLYHQADFLAYSAFIRDGDEFQTREGSFATFNVVVTEDGVEYIVNGEGTFERGNVNCNNGAVHVLDTFLSLP